MRTRLGTTDVSLEILAMSFWPKYCATSSLVVFGNGQQYAIVERKNPATIAKHNQYLTIIWRNTNQRVRRRQHHSMVKFIHQRLHRIAKPNEIDYVMIDVQRTFHLDGNPVVVAMQPLACIDVVRNKMAGTEDQKVLFDADVEIGHICQKLNARVVGNADREIAASTIV